MDTKDFFHLCVSMRLYAWVCVCVCVCVSVDHQRPAVKTPERQGSEHPHSGVATHKTTRTKKPPPRQ